MIKSAFIHSKGARSLATLGGYGDPRYEVSTREDGLLCRYTRNPVFDGLRALRQIGFTGSVTFYKDGNRGPFHTAEVSP